MVQKFKEDDAYYAEPQFFRMFDFGWLVGDKKTALKDRIPSSCRRMETNKFFGDWRSAMGKIVRYENKADFKVTGILKNSPANTDFPIQLVVSFATLRQKGGDFYGNIKDWVSTFGDNHCYIVFAKRRNGKQL